MLHWPHSQLRKTILAEVALKLVRSTGIY